MQPTFRVFKDQLIVSFIEWVLQSQDKTVHCLSLLGLTKAVLINVPQSKAHPMETTTFHPGGMILVPTTEVLG